MDIGGIHVGTGVIVVRGLLGTFFAYAIFYFIQPDCKSTYCSIFLFLLKTVMFFLIILGIDRLIIFWYE